MSRAFPVLPEADRAELRLLLACLRARFDPAAAQEVRTAILCRVDGARFADIARRHRLGAIAARSLKDAGLAAHPAAREVAQAAAVVAVRGLRLVSGLADALDLLAAAGIRPIALKGPLMAADLYGDVGLRPSGDLDLLVPEAQLTAARHALVAAGFRPDPALSERRAIEYLAAGFAYSFRHDARDLVVEIHPTLAHRAFRYAPDMAALWARARETTIAGRSVLTLSPEDRLLFLCVHGAKHEWDQLVWVCDVAEALRTADELDWDGIRERAIATGSMRMLQLGVCLAHAFSGVRLPPEAEALAADPVLPTLAEQVWSRMLDPIERNPSLWRQLRFHRGVRERRAERMWQTHEKVGDRVRGLAQRTRLALSPSAADRAFVRLPRGLSVLYFVVRPVRVLLGARGPRPAEAFPQATRMS